MNAEADTSARRFVAFLESGEAAPGLFTDDVFCDFSAPRWRADATADGYVLEVEERWTDAVSHWYCREMFRMRLRGGAIAHMSAYCTGDSDAARQADHRRAVTLLEP